MIGGYALASETPQLDAIILEGDRTDTVRIDAEFTQQRVEPLLESLLRTYRDSGYYYASISPISATGDDEGVNLHLRVQSGPVVTVSDIRIDGLKKTRPELIRRYLHIAPGDTLFADRIERSAGHLRRLSFVNLERPPDIVPDPGYQTATVHFALSEKRQLLIDGAAGYVPDDDGYVIWYVNLLARNFLGGGRQVSLLADQREKYKSIFDVRYTQPVFWTGIGEIEGRVHTRDYRDDFYEFGVRTAYHLELSTRVRITTSLAWKNVEPADDALRSYASYEAGVGVRIGGIDATRSTRTAYLVDWRISYLGRSYRSGEETEVTRSTFNDTKNEIRLEYAQRLVNGLTGFVGGTFQDVKSSEAPLPTSELFLFGGPGSLRGFRSDQFAARRVLLGTCEWRMFVSEIDYVYPFVDGAYFEWDRDDDDVIVKESDHRWGYGAGIRLASASRALRVEFAWNEDAGFDQPRLLITLSNRF